MVTATTCGLEQHRHLIADLLCAYRVPSAAARDELAADALIGLWNAMRTYSPDLGLSFESFARRKMRHAIQDGLRERHFLSRRLRQQFGENPPMRISFEVFLDRCETTGRQDEHLEDVDRRDLVEFLLGQLSPLVRQWLVERFWQDHTYTHIAADHGVSRKHVAFEIQKALESLSVLARQILD
ncbi:MAG TPA: sigma-70 family RNA polymerase sigma factor [Anaerohalosphaeraceae bacterium]|jgi:RNA polymerase sigma factor (sigma-70 family)|nr:sigma-70 family RNA polymerase sigma factor [Anaerohalosphaeraceae bacterium]HRT88247.1 sigma-70 family RNA polymerase sigma factor [Anaerohalosphaeraceae bacterium]